MILEYKLTFHYVFRVELYSLRVQGQYFLIHLNETGNFTPRKMARTEPLMTKLSFKLWTLIVH